MISQPGKAPTLPSPGKIRNVQHLYPQYTKINDNVNGNNNNSPKINQFEDNSHQYHAPNMNQHDNNQQNGNAWNDDNSSAISDYNQVNFQNYLKDEQEMKNKAKYDQYQRSINHKQNHQNNNCSSDDNKSYYPR